MPDDSAHAAEDTRKLRARFPRWGILFDPLESVWVAVRGKRTLVADSSPEKLTEQVEAAAALVVDHGRETPLLLLELAGQTYAGPDEFAGWLAWRRRLAPDGTGDQALLRVGFGPLARLVGRHHRAGPVRAHSRPADLAVAGEVPAAGNVGTFALAGRGPAVRSVVTWISP